MDFTLDKKHEMARQLFRDFAEKEVKPLAIEVDETEEFPRVTVDKMIKAGFMGIPVPKEYGGQGCDPLTYAMCVEELSKVCGTTGVIVSAHTSLCCDPIMTFGTEEQKQKFLVPLAKGEKLGAFGLTEPGAGTDAQGQQTKAVLDGDEWVLNGSKCFITNGKEADVYVIFAVTGVVEKRGRKMKEISYDEMLELATSGAKVLHNRSVEMAKKYGVELVVRSSLNTEEGTLVKEVAKVEKMLITGVAADKNTARISVMGVEDKPGTAFKIFNTLAKHNINVDIILQSVGRDGTKDITFTVSQDDLKEAMEVMEARKEALTIKEMNYNEKVAKVSIVGAGMLSNPGVAATMFESLSNSNININMISTSEIRITVLIDEKDADRALVAIHDGFGLED